MWFVERHQLEGPVSWNVLVQSRLLVSPLCRHLTQPDHWQAVLSNQKGVAYVPGRACYSGPRWQEQGTV